MMQSLTRPERNRNTKQHTNDLQLWPLSRVEVALGPGLKSQYLIVWVGVRCLKGQSARCKKAIFLILKYPITPSHIDSSPFQI